MYAVDLETKSFAVRIRPNRNSRLPTGSSGFWGELLLCDQFSLRFAGKSHFLSKMSQKPILT